MGEMFGNFPIFKGGKSTHIGRILKIGRFGLFGPIRRLTICGGELTRVSMQLLFKYLQGLKINYI